MVPINTCLTERMERSYFKAIQDHHLIKKKPTPLLFKLNSNELYKIQIIIKYKKPTSQPYFEKIFKNSSLSSFPYCYSEYDYPCF